MSKQIKIAGLTLALAIGLAPFGAAQAQTPPAATATSVAASNVTLYGLSVTNKLVRFNSGAPGTIQNSVQIGGLQSGENLVGIDFRPATGQLWGIGSTSRLYTIDLNSGAATVVGSVLTTTLAGASFGFDFNPAVDRIRVTSDQDQDLRLNPNNGSVAAIDGTLAYTSTDRNAGQNPLVIASAYTNNFPGPAATILYNIDSNLDVLVTQNPPNSGTLNTIGSLGVNAGETGAFDIVGTNTAFAALTTSGEANSTGLYTINLSTGAATMVGTIGGGEAIRGLAASLSAAPATVTPVPAATGSVTVTVTAQTTAQATGTSQATATTQATAQPTSPPAATATTAPPAPTQVIEPTPTQPVVQPTQQPPGMPRTGQMDMTLYIALSLVALSLVGLGWIAHRRTARDMK